MMLEMAFFLGAALVAYTYVGYPLAIGLAARIRPRPVEKARTEGLLPSVSVVVVAHNEEATLGRKLTSLLASDYPEELFEIVVVSDGSTDDTEAIVQSFAARSVRLLRLPGSGPRGKPTGINHGIGAVDGEIVVLTDARQTIGRAAVRELVASFADPDVGAVSGALQLEAPGGAKASGVGAYWSYEKRLRHTESLFDSSVGATGALYAIRRELFRPLDPRTILDDVAIPMRIVLEGRRVLFEPRAEAFDAVSHDAAKELHRKVRTLAGNFQLVSLMPELLSPTRNRLWWQFLSHKIARLAVPWALLVILLSSVALAIESSPGAVFYRAAAAGQLAFYLLAAIGAILPASGRSLRIFRLPYAFVLLNWASALALASHLAGTARVDWKRTDARPEANDNETPIEHESTGGI